MVVDRVLIYVAFGIFESIVGRRKFVEPIQAPQEL
jgi:hypothetical protein